MIKNSKIHVLHREIDDNNEGKKLVQKNDISDCILISVPHYQQKATWDCGLSCVMMVLSSASRFLFLDQFLQICEDEGFDKSTWSIDLVYLLHRFGIKHLYCTVTLGIDPSLSSEMFYKNVLQKDYERILEKFKESSARGVQVPPKRFGL